MSIKGEGGEFLHFQRPFHLGRQGCGFFCCLNIDCCFQTLRVYGGEGTLKFQNGINLPTLASTDAGKYLGYVREDYSFCKPKLSVFNDNDDKVYEIVGDFCAICRHSFRIYDHHKDTKIEHHVGEIRKKWSGLAKELFTDADNFYITFPKNANARERGLLLGALFLIDFLYFENNNTNDEGTY
jgi:hypothetical protein